MFKKTLAILCIGVLVLLPISGTSLQVVEALGTMPYINNSDVMPKYVKDSLVKLEPSDNTGDLMTPDWVKTLVMAQVNISTATKEGTFEAAIKVLDHYQEMGVNGLWVTPIFDPGTTGNGYGNLGINTVAPSLTGMKDYKDGWQVVEWFVYQAHKRNIRIFLDMIVWGTVKESPLYKTHREFYTGEESWGGWGFNWKNATLQNWFLDQTMKIITTTGIDGFRCDLEPAVTGYDMYAKIRHKALSVGRKIAIFSESPNERLSTFDFEQFGVMSYDNWDYLKQLMTPANFFLDKYKIVDAVKNGTGIGSDLSQQMEDGGHYRFYTYNLSNHDYGFTAVNGDLIKIGYQAIYAPFIPLWWMGEEFNQQIFNRTLYFEDLDWSMLNVPKNRAFYEGLKKMIRIRRLYPAIFNNYPVDHRDSNICEVKVGGLEELQAYARYDSKGTGILIVPNNNIQNKTSPFTITIPFSEMQMDNYTSYTVSDLVTGKTIVSGKMKDIGIFKATVGAGTVGAFLVKATGRRIIVKTDTTGVSTDNSSGVTESTTNSTSPTDSQASSSITSSTKNVNAGNDGQNSLPVGLIVFIVISGLLILGSGVFILLLKSPKAPFKKSK